MIHLACTTDAAFARHTGAMLHSALARMAGTPCSIHVLHDGTLPDDALAKLRDVAATGAARVLPVAVPAERLAAFRSGYFPRAVWFRVLLPELLPAIDRVLYLDSDVVVTDDLAPLWASDLQGRWLGAVVNPFYPFMPDHPRTLGLTRREYFNSGVLLMDLAAMRRADTVGASLRFAREHPFADYPDQDCLNDVCRGRWLPLHARWNVQSTLFELPPARLPLPGAEVAEALSRPAVIHFIGPFKPWQYLCRHPRRRLYLEHAGATPWGAPEPEGRTLENAVLRQLPIGWIDRYFRLKRRLGA